MTSYRKSGSRLGKPYQALFDHVLTHLDAERAHQLGFAAIRAATPLTSRRRRLSANSGRDGAKLQAMGLTFTGPLGLAAGFDKNGVGIDALAALGFGFVEIGTVTARPQPGNPRPRLARLPADRAVVNRMGFNNDGAEMVARRLAARRASDSEPPRRQFGENLSRLGIPVGVNIGKTKMVPADDQAAVIADYQESAGLLAPYADYLVVNVSSPNTPGLRHLQALERLEPLLDAVRTKADDATADQRATPVPLLVKIAPDLADDDVLAVADLALSVGLDGIVATNTTLSRDGLASPSVQVEQAGEGGLSGAPLRARANEVVRMLRERVGPQLCLIGVGGIGSAHDATDRIEAGADLVQAYTAFVYEGPSWPRRVNDELVAHARRAVDEERTSP